jgi:AraC-like DNA-binding protein/mannose-6-phosphate isomerase-like protein (cupin superfamily)
MSFDYQKRLSTKIPESAVTALLNKMSMESVFCTHSTFSSPWGISMPAIENSMMFHLVLEGKAKLQVQSDSIQMNAGDFILLPKGTGHNLSDDKISIYTPLNNLPIEIVNESFERLAFGGGGTNTIMLCGAITFRHPLTMRLLGILPHQIAINKDSNVNHVVNTLAELLSNEALNTTIGSSGAISRLADLMVITALRQHLEAQRDNKLCWLGALEDQRISKAIQLVHESPSSHWSLEGLSSEVGMSRTGFAVKFKRLVGNSPMDYLTEWRMSLAYIDLQNTKASILSIAMDYGYQSETAFSRAFKKITGHPPSVIRKRAHSA